MTEPTTVLIAVLGVAVLAGASMLVRATLHRSRVAQPPGPLTTPGVDREMTVELAIPTRGIGRVPVILRYDLADPYAVVAMFRRSSGEVIRWVFARDLLAQGLGEPAGVGDVRLRPFRAGAEAGVCIVLSSPDGEVVVRAAAGGLAEFLRATYLLCPAGTEGDHLDVDHELRALLAS